MTRSLLIATGNAGKLREFRSLLALLPYRILSPSDAGVSLEVEEDGATYAENAAKKALAYAAASGLPSLADDTGLEVDALNGAPGLYSARYCPDPNADDAARRAYLVKNLGGMPRPWRARFRAVIALALPTGEVYFSEGVCEGEILPSPRGDDGFGYDPIFFLPELGRTFAELSMEEKNRLSHRARAVRQAIPLLKEILGG